MSPSFVMHFICDFKVFLFPCFKHLSRLENYHILDISDNKHRKWYQKSTNNIEYYRCTSRTSRLVQRRSNSQWFSMLKRVNCNSNFFRLQARWSIAGKPLIKFSPINSVKTTWSPQHNKILKIKKNIKKINVFMVYWPHWLTWPSSYWSSWVGRVMTDSAKSCYNSAGSVMTRPTEPFFVSGWIFFSG